MSIQKRAFAVSGDRVFVSEQGEGATAGKPAVFLRLHHCNLDCGWCDTPYTWNRAMREYYEEREKWSIEKTVETIASKWKASVYHGSAEPRLIITGGEPLLQQKGIVELLNCPEFSHWHIEVETNGTIAPLPPLLCRIQWNCSPKLANSGVPLERRLYPDVLRVFTHGNTYFKFVVQNENDIDEIIGDYLPHLAGFPRSRIFISPEGRDTETLDAVIDRTSGRVSKEGFVLGDRLQIRRYGDKRRT